jgi:Cu-Zn family superoxide dismutase
MPNVISYLHRIHVRGIGSPVGYVLFSGSGVGATMSWKLWDLPPGPHGFHVHNFPCCQPGPDDSGTIIPAGAAGSHYDPEGTKSHQGPLGRGHRGDLPLIQINAFGQSEGSMYLPRLSAQELLGRSIILHAGGDTYSDVPKLGGGGARLACGLLALLR